MEAKVLTAQSLCKRYGTLDALDHVDLTLEPGHIYGLIGRNGAGKTTLLSALTAQTPVDAGTVTYGGAPVWENEAVLGELCFSRELGSTVGRDEQRLESEGLPERPGGCFIPIGTKPMPKS